MDRCNPRFEADIVVGGYQQILPGTPATPANQFVTVVSGEFRLEEPVAIATHLSSFSQGDWFYFAGTPSIPGDIVTTSIFERVRLCNVVDQFTRRLAEGEDVPATMLAQDLFAIYPALERMSGGDNWQLVLETETGVTVLSPVTLFWLDAQGKRFTSVDLTQGRDRLLLEFVFQSAEPATLRSASLILKEAPDLSLAAQINEAVIQSKLFEIDQWLSFYSRNESPFVISAQGVAQVVTEAIALPAEVAMASGQARLISACLLAYLVTGIAQYRARALFLAEAFLNYFFPEPIPVDTQTFWAPHWLVNAGQPFVSQGPTASKPENYGEFDVAVEFVNGVGQLPESALAEVYKAYTGELTWPNVAADLATGRSYAIAYWIDANGQQQTPTVQVEEIVQPEGHIFYVDDRENHLISPIYSAFALGAY